MWAVAWGHLEGRAARGASGPWSWGAWGDPEKGQEGGDTLEAAAAAGGERLYQATALTPEVFAGVGGTRSGVDRQPDGVSSGRKG